MTRPSRYPVSSFGPELLAVLIKGARERVDIPCPDMRTMQALQMRIQMLRGAMGREKHPQYDLVTRARTSRTWDREVTRGGDQKCILVIQPNDAQFGDILTQAGITVTQNDRDILEETPAPRDTPNDPTIEPTTTTLNPLDPYARFKP